jgi:hypothetical protein
MKVTPLEANHYNKNNGSQLLFIPKNVEAKRATHL